MTEFEKKYLLSLLCNEDNMIKVHNTAIENSGKNTEKEKLPMSFALVKNSLLENKTLINGFIQINTFLIG